MSVSVDSLGDQELRGDRSPGPLRGDQLRHPEPRNRRPRILRTVLAALHHPRLLVVRDEFPALLAAVGGLLRLAFRPHQPAVGAVAEHQDLEVVALRARHEVLALVARVPRGLDPALPVDGRRRAHDYLLVVLELSGALHRQRYGIALRSCAGGIPVNLVQQQIPDRTHGQAGRRDGAGEGDVPGAVGEHLVHRRVVRIARLHRGELPA